MGIFSRLEGKVEDTVEGAASSLSRAPISPVQISRRCEKQMARNKMLGAGKQYAPTLYTVLVNPEDDSNLYTFYPTLAGEIETYLRAKAGSAGLYMDGAPLVRFIVDDGLKRGKFDVIAEVVASSIIYQLRQEEMQHYAQVRAEAARSSAQAAAAAAGVGAAGAGAAGGVQPYTPAGEEYDAYDEYDDVHFSAEDPYDPHLDVEDPFAPATGAGGAVVAGGAGAAGAAVNSAGGAGAAAASANDGAAGAAAGGAAGTPKAANGAAPAASATHTPRLISHDGKQVVQLTHNKMIAGRAEDNEIVVPDINASRKHAEFTRDISGRWTLRDLGSKNGTILNGNILQEPAMLYEGDIITLGLSKYKFTQK